MKRNAAYAVAAVVMALTLAAGIEVCTLLPYLAGRWRRTRGGSFDLPVFLISELARAFCRLNWQSTQAYQQGVPSPELKARERAAWDQLPERIRQAVRKP